MLSALQNFFAYAAGDENIVIIIIIIIIIAMCTLRHLSFLRFN